MPSWTNICLSVHLMGAFSRTSPLKRSMCAPESVGGLSAFPRASFATTWYYVHNGSVFDKRFATKDLTMTYYRVSKKVYADGRELIPTGTSSSDASSQGRQIEEILEAVRAAEFPTKRPRLESLPIFSTERCAQRYWWKMTDGRMYEVAIDESAINHRGDMMLLHDMENVLSDAAAAIALARRYWNGEQTSAPCEEIYVKKAVVVRDVTPDDKQAVFDKLYKLPSSPPPGSDLDDVYKSFDKHRK